MRLKSLYVKDFRSIDGEVNISLDAPIVLIHGPNGAGKTSLLSAIELALTGTVPSLSRAEPDYLAYLPHKDRPFGEVRLEVTGSDGATLRSDLRVTTTAVTGNALLGEGDASFFSERSYLAQATLGRLLEIYQHADKKSDSPLTKFVKEVLGLDRMEALIGGLHSAGNIARLKVPVSAYGEMRDQITKDETELQRLRGEMAQERAALQTGTEALRLQLAAIDPLLVNLEPAEAERRLGLVSEDADLTALVRLRRELEVSLASWQAATSQNAAPDDRNDLEAANQADRSALDKWLFEHGQTLEALLGRAAGFFSDISLSSESGYLERATVLTARIANDRERIERVLAGHETALQKRSDLDRQLVEARARLARLDLELAGVSTANEALARGLSDLMTHVEGDICPVCDRDYAEVSETPLSAHVAAKVAEMIEQAGRLQSLVSSRGSTQAEVSRLDRELQAAASGMVLDAELTALKTRGANLTEVERQLGDARAKLEEGDRQAEAANRSARALAATRNADQSVIVLRNSVEDLARRLDLTFEPSTSTEKLLASLSTTIQHQEAALTARQTARRIAIEMAQFLVISAGKQSTLAASIDNLESELAVRKQRKAQADSIIEIAKDMTRKTREARGRVVRRVFNDELNSVWRDLFVRLAPEEPFIPAFAIPESANADVEAVLETRHRRGGKGGNPRAMLSAGNLNTAALTLFLALHLSVKPRLPWLVIDDPVQSMDEVHIAQFAALLRTLSKQMQRQVIVAVHERSLFDYLALELSPAFEGDRLNIVELGRNAIGETTGRWDARLFVADRAIAA
ncbi:AAA family ATPase [uncultured Sphingomonas sp.]|uniref:AAA family ATPase n=1 Tax=uncultured Sphingomonas sp. TaxID=158754 RepID=UPI0025FEE316|nr:AAA family ATPase [uncultured Sphingomonas sp.]